VVHVLQTTQNLVISRISFSGHRPDFILPDRKKYVSMDKQYLKSYMDLVVKVISNLSCRTRSSGDGVRYPSARGAQKRALVHALRTRACI